MSDGEGAVGCDKSGYLSTRWAHHSLYCHYGYALQPGTMIFHHRRLASVVWKPQAICVLWNPFTPGVTERHRQAGWRAQKKAFSVIQNIRRKHWLAAVSVTLLCGFENQMGSTDVTVIILKLLEDWHKSMDPEQIRTHTGYYLDEAIEEALQGASVICAPKRRKLCWVSLS